MTASNPAQVAAFLTDLAVIEEAQPALFNGGGLAIFPAQRKYGVLDENQCDLDLDVLAADVQGAGWGSAMMQILTALADRHGLDIYVRANADDEEDHPDSIRQGELEAFYAGFGFVDVGSWSVRDLVRRAKAPTTALYRVEPRPGALAADWIKQGQKASGHTEAQGRWFTTDQAALDWYKRDAGEGATIYSVEVPTSDLEKYRVTNSYERIAGRSVKSFSRDPENEFFLPRAIAGTKKPVALDGPTTDAFLERAFTGESVWTAPSPAP